MNLSAFIHASLLFLAAIGAASAANLLLILGDSNGTVKAGDFSKGERFLRDRLTAAGHVVRSAPDSASRDSLLRAAAASDLVLVFESVTSAKLLAKLKATPTPLVNCEAFIQDDMGFTPAGPPGDPGAPDRFALGVLADADALTIRAPSHPLAAGLSGRVVIYTAPKSITWGKVAPAGEVVATLATDTAGASIYMYAKGARLYDGTLAAGLRIGCFLEDDNVTGTPNLMTPAGLKLFDAAVAYGLGGSASSLARLVPVKPKSPETRADLLGRNLRFR